MKKSSLNTLLNEFDTFQIEQLIFKTYLENKNVNYQESELLQQYFNELKDDEEIMEKVQSLSIETFDQLENAMELLIPKDDRELNGAFFTPKFIVDYIINEVSPKRKAKVIDPSCGCGAFLLGIIRYYEEQGVSIKQIVNENLYGADILEYNVRRAKLLISIYAIEKGVVLKENDFNIERKDSLRASWPEQFDAVVGNPPYVKFQDLTEENRSYLKDNWKSIDKGTYNIYFAFFELGYKLLKETGKLGYITPNNYFTSLAGESLRKYFSDNKSIYKIIDFNHYKIFDAQTYTCLTFLNKAMNNTLLFNKMYGSDPISFLNEKSLSRLNKKALNDKKWRLLRESEQENIRKIESIGIPLKELFIINVGIATLKDTLYFIDGRNKDGDFYYKTYNDKSFPIESGLVKSIYKISDFSNQDECDHNERKIIFPYTIDNGKAVIISESNLKVEFPKGYQYLLAVKDELEKRGKDKPTPFYIYGRSQGLNKFGIRLLTPTFSQRPKFLLVEEFDSLYCNGYGLHYKEDFKKGASLFDDRPIQDKANIDVLQKILNSEIMNYYVTHTSVSIQGGYPCYQKNFIERFTIPELSEEEIRVLRASTMDDVNQFLLDKYQIKLAVPNLA